MNLTQRMIAELQDQKYWIEKDGGIATIDEAIARLKAKDESKKFGNDTPDDGIDWEQVRMESIEADYERDEDDEM